MDKELLRQALGKLLLGVLLTALLLFLPAGTLHWWNAWLLMAVLFVPMLIAGLVMLFKAPELLRRRLNAKERQTEQKGVIAWSGLLFIASFVYRVVSSGRFRFSLRLVHAAARLVPAVCGGFPAGLRTLWRGAAGKRVPFPYG